jgi:phenylpyruvate tautomerase PptA (4-oxalocrotonate tautomerase family)
MPTYFCTTTEGRFSQKEKSNIAQEITRIHSDVTGAPSYFAQVIFNELKPGNYFMNGVLLRHDQIFVYGTIRAGRATVDKSRMIVLMAEALGEITGGGKRSVIVYVGELPPRQMIEFGHVLPEPGDELIWTAALPTAEREWMQSVGK